jgi:hypothetical protein
LTDDVGVIQHALETVPYRKTGYCTDDVARAFIVALARLRHSPADEVAHRLAGTCLAFLQDAQLDDGRFHNLMAYDRTWLDEVGSQDSCGRAIWAIGYGLVCAPNKPWRRVCRILFDRAMPAIESLEFLRSRAFAMLGLAYALPEVQQAQYASTLRLLADGLRTSFRAASAEDWQWYEGEMTYDNARLPEAMIRAGQALDAPEFGNVGLQTLAFYEATTIEDGIFVPIGNHGWYRRGGRRARYAQQPLEACAFADAELAAFDATGAAAHFANAQLGLAWFYGKNSRGITMAHGGGCYDGLEEDGVNHNMGAESTLAMLATGYAVAERRAQTLRAVR